jgi:hypothetical protein
MSAHMIFSGILGYFYGMTRYSKALISFEYWTKQSSVFWQNTLEKFQGLASWFKTNTLLFVGLFWALALHFIFNVLLHYNQIFLVMGEIILGFAFLLYLLAKKSGGLQYAESASVLERATPDQKVIFELLGTWMIEGKYKDVMDVCQRYLAKDAHNNLIQLFLARAMDEQRITDIQDAFAILFESKTKIKKDTSLRGMVQRKIMMELLQGTLTAKSSELLSQAKVKDKEKLVAWMLKLNGQTWTMDSKILESSVHNFEPVDSTKALHVSTDIV